MKIHIELIPGIEETEITIRCSDMSPEISQMHQAILETTQKRQQFIFFKDEMEYFLSLDEVIFFETSENQIHGHTLDDVYQVKYRLYELEDVLPGNFMRVSKSTILNTDKIYSITKSLAAANTVSFINTHKQVFVSRYYYRALKEKLENRRFRL